MRDSMINVSLLPYMCAAFLQIVEDVLSFIGGFHTSAYYLTMLFWYLAQNDDIQEKLHDEIEKEVGDDHGDRLKHYTLKSKT